ncbi:MAG: hypothetical protein ACJ8AO_00095 [Gemmatimonadaceae bacterium]
MAVREFKDKSGTTWRAWDITPEAILPQTKAEEYLADCFRQGWIVFENLSTGEKRRLSPYPLDWEHLHDTQLEALLWLNAAPVLSNRRAPAAAAPAEPPCDEDDDAVRDAKLGRVQMGALGVVRGFRYPGGRVWDVRVEERPEGGGPPVLRFQSGFRRFDLRDWPAGWAEFTDDQLVALLRSAAPRDEPWHEGLPQRRHDDRGDSADDARR